MKKNWAVNLFHLVASRVPAYKDFLRRNQFNVFKVKTIVDFKNVPIIDKRNYLKVYQYPDIFIDRKTPPMIYESSGSAGKALFWFRGDMQENLGGLMHEKICRDVFKIDKNESTLVIICFSMGVWIAGVYTLLAFRFLSRRGWNISVITPGVEKEDIFYALKELTPKFKNLILAGYPPFLMDIVNEAISRKISFKKLNVKFLTAGDKFTEQWRDDLLSLLKMKNSYNSFVSIYGSADAGILGYETSLSIFLRRKALVNKDFAKVLFGDFLGNAMLFQYDPSTIFFEEFNGELIFTVNGGIPLVRYNIRDRGKLISYQKMKEIVKKFDFEKESILHGLNFWRQPFVIVSGRNDVAVTFYALNIFPENIKAGIESKKISRWLSGKFLSFNKTFNKGKVQKLYIQVELKQGVKLKGEIFQSVLKSITDNLIKLNIEYRKLYSILGEKALPIIEFAPFGGLNFKKITNRGLLNISGKKSKIIEK